MTIPARYLGSLLALAPPLLAQPQIDPAGARSPLPITAAGPQAQLTEWRARYGPAWSTHLAERTGKLELLFGGSAPPSFQPDTSVDADWFRSSREWIVATEAMHGVSAGDLVDERVFFLPLAQGNTTDKITVRLEQWVDGVPVEDGCVNVLFALDGRLLSLQTTAAPFIDDRDARPSFDAGAASWIARETFTREVGLVPNHLHAPRLTFARVDEGEGRRWLLAWQVDAQHLEDGFEPRGTLYTIDARSRAILRRESSIHQLDVTGTVRTMATPGVTADHPGNPPQQQPMPHAEVSSSVGTVVTDSNGAFIFPRINTPLDLTVRYSGTFADVLNDAGTEFEVTFPNVQPNQVNSLVLNVFPTQGVTAQANAFLGIGALRDWIRAVFPNDSTADFLATARVNVSLQCNAFFTGTSTIYAAAGHGCNNAAFRSVVAHEMGHWLNVRYGTGNNSDGMGEGNADIFSLYMLDHPLIASFIYHSGGYIRSGLNLRQFCGDQNFGCHGSPHNNGEVWMGAAWKVRTRLKATLGAALGGRQADLLFLGWMNAYDQESLRSIIEAQWLTLDDDDGDISNGTPNFEAIDGGFRLQGFPGFGLRYIGFSEVTALETTTDQVGPYTVRADIVARLRPPLSSAELRYRVDGGPVQTVPMLPLGGDTYAAAIPGQSAPASVEYIVGGTDGSANTEWYPGPDLAQGLQFGVGQEHILLDLDFENGPSAWLASGLSQARGLWEHGDPHGTAAQPEDDHTPDPGSRCWFTGQGVPGAPVDANDVDSGSTFLRSNQFSLVGIQRPQISYWRWYSNGLGGPRDDTFEVRLSSDSGMTWTTVERLGPLGPHTSGGWFRHTFDPRSFVTPSGAMKLLFVASDTGLASVVEAAIDDVLVTSLEQPLAPPTNHCTVARNSTGAVGQIQFVGSQSVHRNDARLRAAQMPSGALGLFFFGSDPAQVPVPGTAAVLCVAGTIYRFPITSVDAQSGTAEQVLDFAAPASPARFITAGSTWHFQFWHRDVLGGVPTSNTSPGLRVAFGS
jgi:hypothetical protein